MRYRNWSRMIQAVMVLALITTGFPLLRASAWWPEAPLPEAPQPNAMAQIGDQIAVDAEDSLSPEQLQALNERYGLDLRLNSEHADEEKLLISTVDPAAQAGVLEKLQKDPLIEAAEPLRRYSIKWVPNDPRYKEQWNFKLIGAEQAWDRARGKGVVVAVIDTGVAYENDAKCYRAIDFGETRFTGGYDFVNNDKHPNDDHGHGTHVAGTIAESTNNAEGVTGLAFEATIMPVKVLDAFGGGTSADIADAIRWAADHGAQVVNMSLGGPAPDQVMRLACKYAQKKGVLIVCAAGNSGGGPVGYPAGFPECLAVSAVGPSGNLAPYSSIGKQVAIAAPGGDKTGGEKDGVLQNTVLDGQRESGDGYYAFQGTSMASPHVAAAAALVMSMGVKDHAQVRQILERSATPKKPQNKYGAGILNVAKATELAAGEHRNSLFKMLFALIAGVLGAGIGALRGRVTGLMRFPYAPLGFVLGALGPDLIFGWLGFGSPWNILLHSALVPLLLLSEAESKRVLRFVAALGLGVALHLGWDAFQGHVPFSGILPLYALPWLWVNTAVGAGVALVAWVRSLGTE